MIQNYISLLCSIGNNPLKYWNKDQSFTGSIRVVLDYHLLQNVVELRNKNNKNFEKTGIICPNEPTKVLNITLPYLVIVIKNIETYCIFKLQIIDKNKNRFYLYFYNDTCEKRHVIKTPNVQIVEIKYEKEWNKIELNLPKIVWQAFQINYEAVQRLQISGSCRLRRIYFIDKHYNEFDISTKLCQNFFDFYMLKWGHCKIERSSQTGKSKCTSPCDPENFPIIYLNFSDINKNVNKYYELPKYKKREKTETNFSKLLRATCRHTIDNFFNVSSRSSCCLKNPKLESLSTAGVEKQKILLASIKFINNIQNTNFSFIKEPFSIKDQKNIAKKIKKQVNSKDKEIKF